jgi:hypothetical protein
LLAESNEPAFLRRLRGEVGGEDGARQERRVVTKRPQSTEDDEPTYVLESNDTISKVEYDALLQSQSASERGTAPDAGKVALDETASASADAKTNARPSQRIAEAGQRKKRKAARIVGEEDDEIAAKYPGEKTASTEKAFEKTASAQSVSGKKASAHQKAPKPKKKQIKLSFDQD